MLRNSDHQMTVGVAVFGADVGGDVGASAASKLLDEGLDFPLMKLDLGEVPVCERQECHSNPDGGLEAGGILVGCW